MQNTPAITFIVPAFNSEKTICETLESIVNQTANQSYEILIIDDGSTDSTASIVKQWHESQSPSVDLKLLESKRQGEAGAMNCGIEHASGAFVAWVESDVKIAPDWLENLLACFETADVMGAGGLLFPAENDGLTATIFGFEITAKIQLNQRYPLHITSANAIYRKTVFDELGPCALELGESSFDSEYNERIRHAGYRLRLEKTAHAWHHFKPGLFDSLRRSWWYGFRRPYVNAQVLYPFDRYIGLLALSSGAALPAFFLLFVFPAPAAMLLAFIAAAHAAYSAFLFSLFRRWELSLSPPVFFLRNIVFLSAYACGWIDKLVFHAKKNVPEEKNESGKNP